MPNPHTRNLYEWLRQWGARNPVVPPLADVIAPTVLVDDATPMRRPIHGNSMIVTTARGGTAGTYAGAYVNGRASGIWVRQLWSEFNTVTYVIMAGTDLTSAKTPLSTLIGSDDYYTSLPNETTPSWASEFGSCVVPVANIRSWDARIPINSGSPLFRSNDRGLYVPPGRWFYALHSTAAAGSSSSIWVEEVPLT